MLSVLIPIYCYDVRPFVKNLHHQAQQLDIAWEILLLDDASPHPWGSVNQELEQLDGVRFEVLPTNHGRAAIRNILAQRAQFDHLLFLDCDGGIERPDFLAAYAQQLNGRSVLYGGRSYRNTPPDNPDRCLHWYYGQEREVSSVAKRQQRPYHGFMTNNFCIPKAIFSQHRLDERIRQYGHEDTLLGLQLQKAGVPIIHFDNPLLHIGLEAAEDWLSKQRQAIQNLYWLQTQYPELSSSALRSWRFLRRIGLMQLLYPLLQICASGWQQKLINRFPPQLRLLDLLKLHWLEEAHRQNYTPHVAS